MLIRHLWQLKIVVFLHWRLIRAVLLKVTPFDVELLNYILSLMTISVIVFDSVLFEVTLFNKLSFGIMLFDVIKQNVILYDVM